MHGGRKLIVTVGTGIDSSGPNYGVVFGGKAEAEPLTTPGAPITGTRVATTTANIFFIPHRDNLDSRPHDAHAQGARTPSPGILPELSPRQTSTTITPRV